MWLIKMIWTAYNWPFDKLFDAIPDSWEQRDYKVLTIGSVIASTLAAVMAGLAPDYQWMTISLNICLGNISGRAFFLGWKI